MAEQLIKCLSQEGTFYRIIRLIRNGPFINCSTSVAFKDFTQFTAWQKAFELLLRVYKLSEKFPKDERFGLISDMRRAANSVVHNIAEGFGRYERRDKTRFYKISRGSAYETMSQALVSQALSYINPGDKNELIHGYQGVIDEIDRLIKSVESR